MLISGTVTMWRWSRTSSTTFSTSSLLAITSWSGSWSRFGRKFSQGKKLIFIGCHLRSRIPMQFLQLRRISIVSLFQTGNWVVTDAADGDNCVVSEWHLDNVWVTMVSSGACLTLPPVSTAPRWWWTRPRRTSRRITATGPTPTRRRSSSSGQEPQTLYSFLSWIVLPQPIVPLNLLEFSQPISVRLSRL